MSTNVLLHVEPFPHIVLKQCRRKGLDEHKLMLSTNILLIFRLALWALALWAQMALWALVLWARVALWALALWAQNPIAKELLGTHI